MLRIIAEQKWQSRVKNSFSNREQVDFARKCPLSIYLGWIKRKTNLKSAHVKKKHLLANILSFVKISMRHHKSYIAQKRWNLVKGRETDDYWSFFFLIEPFVWFVFLVQFSRRTDIPPVFALLAMNVYKRTIRTINQKKKSQLLWILSHRQRLANTLQSVLEEKIQLLSLLFFFFTGSLTAKGEKEQQCKHQFVAPRNSFYNNNHTSLKTRIKGAERRWRQLMEPIMTSERSDAQIISLWNCVGARRLMPPLYQRAWNGRGSESGPVTGSLCKAADTNTQSHKYTMQRRRRRQRRRPVMAPFKSASATRLWCTAQITDHMLDWFCKYRWSMSCCSRSTWAV